MLTWIVTACVVLVFITVKVILDNNQLYRENATLRSEAASLTRSLADRAAEVRKYKALIERSVQFDDPGHFTSYANLREGYSVRN